MDNDPTTRPLGLNTSMFNDQRNFRTSSPAPMRFVIPGKVLTLIFVLSDEPFTGSIITPRMSTISTSSSSSSTLGSQNGMAGVSPVLFSPTGQTGYPAERFLS